MSVETRRLLQDINLKYDIYNRLNNELDTFILKCDNENLFNNQNDNNLIFDLMHHEEVVRKAKENLNEAIKLFKDNWRKITISEEKLNREHIEKGQTNNFEVVKIYMFRFGVLDRNEEYKRNEIYHKFLRSLNSLRK